LIYAPGREVAVAVPKCRRKVAESRVLIFVNQTTAGPRAWIEDRLVVKGKNVGYTAETA
jgi:hypothetical protein